jgi:RNA polymerase sigma-70 factor (ECF subfamily)
LELYLFDKEYVDRLRGGDPATEQHFVSYFGQILGIMLRARRLPPERVDDVRQETSYKSQPLETGHLEPPDKIIDLERSLISSQTKEQVRTILDELGQRDRDLLRAIFLEEGDKDEVCRRFGVDRDYLRVRLHRAKERFRLLYQKDLPKASTTGSGSTAKAVQ